MKAWIAGAFAAGLIAAALGFLGAEEKRPEPRPRDARKAAVTVAMVRHAEKDDDAKDPGLTEAGRKRAARLAQVFSKAKLDLLIASELRRTRETLEPLARGRKMEITAIAESKQVVDALKALPPGSVALVCHHSYTIDEIAKGLGVPASEIERVRLDEYDNLLIVSYHAELEPRILNLSY